MLMFSEGGQPTGHVHSAQSAAGEENCVLFLVFFRGGGIGCWPLVHVSSASFEAGPWVLQQISPVVTNTGVSECICKPTTAAPPPHPLKPADLVRAGFCSRGPVVESKRRLQ